MRANILNQIVATKEVELAQRAPRAVTPAILREAVAQHGPRRPFLNALRSPNHPGCALIAEIKKASPSAGVIRPAFDPIQIARTYEAGGADCLSVLTDEKFFHGSLAHLRAVRETVGVPLLRKDFIIHEVQILEAIESGADAILLIVAILDDGSLRRFHELATTAGLAVLVEVHDEEELDRAIASGARLIGVNNRDLRTFTVDLATSERLASRLWKALTPAEALLVAESGITSRADVDRLADAGARAILVGETLMRHGHVQEKIRELLG
jgi:indole-3-glycerol phosphate synthase